MQTNNRPHEQSKESVWITYIALLLAGSYFIISVFFNRASAAQTAKPTTRVSENDVAEAYQYLIGRFLVLRQENLDMKEGFKWNEFIHRKPAGVQWANPNLDVVYSEAWIGIDKNSCTILEVPEIKDRYYTVQTLNGWGETTSNVNERNFSRHPYGKFAYCLKDAKVSLTKDTQRINLPNEKSRVLARIEIGKNADEATKLQKKLKIYPTWTPKIAPTASIPMFSLDHLPGVEIFDNASAILASEKDINPGMEGLQKKVRLVQDSIKIPEERTRIDAAISKKAIPQFLNYTVTLGKHKNGWNRPSTIGNYGNDYKTRSMVNLAGIWANNNREAVYFVSVSDDKGQPLNGSNEYTITFPKGKHPQSFVKYFWSVVAVDGQQFHVIDNPLKRYILNSQSDLRPNADGSLTLVLSSKAPSAVLESNWLPTAPG